VIGIVGGGLTGLALGHELERRGTEWVLLEAAPRPGGVIRSLSVGDHVLEAGPQRARMTPSMRSLIDELDLGDRVVAAPDTLPLLVYHAGELRRVPLDATGLLRTSLLSLPARLRLLAEPLTEGLRAEESVRDFLVRKFGQQAYSNVLGPLYGGLYASDPADMPARHALRGTLEEMGIRRSVVAAMLKRRLRGSRRPAAPPFSFVDGMQELTDALWRRHAGRVRTGSRVRRIARRGAGWVLLLEGSAETIECSHVVVTVPADAAAALLRDVDPDASARLARLRYNPLAIAHLRSELELRALGYQVAFGESLETRGVTFNHALFERTGVQTAFLGGARNPGIVDMPDEWIGEISCNEFRHVTGADAALLNIERARVPAWDASWAALGGLELPDGIRLAANYESRIGIPGRLGQARALAAELGDA